MISKDDARYTIELLDRYIILPQKLHFLIKKFLKKMLVNFELKDNFKYSSDSNNMVERKSAVIY